MTALGHLSVGIGALPWPARIATTWDMVVPTPAYMRWRYQLRPAWLWPLAYFIRWGRGIADAARMAGLWLKQKSHRLTRPSQ